MSMFNCRKCEASSWQPFEDDLCDNCWEKEHAYIQCGSCEIQSPEPTDEGECPNCRSGNWVWGSIDESYEERKIQQGELEAEIRKGGGEK